MARDEDGVIYSKRLWRPMHLIPLSDKKKSDKSDISWTEHHSVDTTIFL